MPTLKDLQKEIEQIISKSPEESDPMHSKLVLKNVLALKPDADEALQIAALAHDIERAVPERTLLENFNNREGYKQAHSIRSAQITTELLKKYGYNKRTIKKVTDLIEQHEIGNSGDVKILKEADSLTYFQYNLDFYYKLYGPERTEKKIQYMYNRLSEAGKKEVNKIELPGELKKIIQKTLSEK